MTSGPPKYSWNKQTNKEHMQFSQWNLHKFTHQTRGLNQDAHNITHSIGSSPLLDPNSPWWVLRFFVTDKTPHSKTRWWKIRDQTDYPLVGGRWRFNLWKGSFLGNFTIFLFGCQIKNTTIGCFKQLQKSHIKCKAEEADGEHPSWKTRWETRPETRETWLAKSCCQDIHEETPKSHATTVLICPRNPARDNTRRQT